MITSGHLTLKEEALFITICARIKTGTEESNLRFYHIFDCGVNIAVSSYFVLCCGIFVLHTLCFCASWFRVCSLCTSYSSFRTSYSLFDTPFLVLCFVLNFVLHLSFIRLVL